MTTPSWVTDHAAWHDAVAEVERDCGSEPEPAPPQRRITPANLDVSVFLRQQAVRRSMSSGIVLEGGDTWIEKPPPPPPPPGFSLRGGIQPVARPAAPPAPPRRRPPPPSTAAD